MEKDEDYCIDDFKEPLIQFLNNQEYKRARESTLTRKEYLEMLKEVLLMQCLQV